MKRLSALLAALLAPLLLSLPACAEGFHQLEIQAARYGDAREALVDAIETEGLVPAPPSQFGDMLARTGTALDHLEPVYGQAEVLHFCSARIAWQLALENPANIAQCPLSMAIYTLAGRAGTVHLAWRQAAGDSPGARAANALLDRIARQTSENAGRSAIRH